MTAIDISELYPNKEVQYPNKVMMYVLVKDDDVDIPDDIAIHDSCGSVSFEHHETVVNGHIYLISGIGQAIHNWVKKIGTMWINTVPHKDNWVLVRPV